MSNMLVATVKSIVAELLANTMLWFVTVILELIFGIPVRFAIRLRGKPDTTNLKILTAHGKTLPIKLVETANWFSRNAYLYPLVLKGKLNLVGISMRGTEQTDVPPLIKGQRAGLISLYLIRKSSRLAFSNALDCDLEYIRNRAPYSDISLFLQAMVALILHQNTEARNADLDVFGIKLQNISMKDAICLLNDGLKSRKKRMVCFVNADCMNKAFVDREYYDILISNEIVFPDGSGINLAAKILGSYLQENLNGTDMLPYLCEQAVKEGYRIFLLGAAEGVAESMKQKLEEKYPGLLICGTRNGYFDWDTESAAVIHEINSVGTDIVLIAFGAPLQEKFMLRFGDQIDAPLLMGVGGLFDFYSGRISRAPLWMRQIGMEWVFRLIQEPKRMWKRYIIGNPLFIFRVHRWLRNGRINLH